MLSLWAASSLITVRANAQSGHMEVAMIINDMYDSDVGERVMTHEAVLHERLLPELEWDETDDARVVEELLGRSSLGE
jgi:hypothetical protein